MRRRGLLSTLFLVLVAAATGAALEPASDSAHAAARCGSIQVSPYGQNVKATVRVRVYRGSVSCRSARRAIRYALERRPSPAGLPGPRGWTCARGAPSQDVTATGMSCATKHRPLRIVEGIFPS